MKDQALQAINIEELVDIQDIQIDTSLPIADRRKSYQQQIKNDRCYRFEDTVVRVSFLDSGPNLTERMKQYLLSGQGAELTSA
jgi:hypothetical protein